MNPIAIGITVLLCAVSSMAGAAQAKGVTSKQSSTQTLRFVGAGPHTLEVRAITGAIVVEAYDGRDVEMVVDRSIDAETEEDLHDAEREVVLDTSDNSAVIQAIVRHPNAPVCGENFRNWPASRPRYEVRFDFKIRVPRATRLELCTINRGDITVAGTRGDFDLTSINGPIVMSDIGGAGRAITVNGRVTASFVSAPSAASVFRTLNGDVVVTLPEGLAADLRMKTFNGGLYTDYEVQPLPALAVATPQRQDGKFVYRPNEFTRVRVGGGGPELTLDTFNGDARVLRRAR